MKVHSISNDFVPFDKIENQKKEDIKGFDEILKDFIGKVNSDLKEAGVAEEKLISGDVKNLEELMYKIEKADISLRLITEIRNKALESYQDIMRMQV
ncbi:flagellar hook-basal body complex protein FliE [Nitrosophilus kaiyonis]|uniref:flagellar hook-basal body complex protein FliE n=1 Tax=Nitrosophilus kaiyonis TaxID=2930200 RepID=UPI00248FF486|nr:flagellar hook-basal body complex protein FliE [Nitrosophilus kaiyonis]